MEGVNTTPIPRTFHGSAHVIFPAWLKFVFVSRKKSSSHLARFTQPLLHIPPALQIRLPYCSFHMEMTTATIHNTERRLANWLNRTSLNLLQCREVYDTIQGWHRGNSHQRWSNFLNHG